MNVPLPRGSALVEVAPGVWVKPRMVTMVAVRWTGTNGPDSASVQLTSAGELIKWSFAELPEAKQFASAIVKACNEEMGIAPRHATPAWTEPPERPK